MKPLRLILTRNPIYSNCPECGSFSTLHRSRSRTALESLIKKFTIWKIYRCKNCGWRGFKSTIIISRSSFGQFFFYLLLAVIAGLIIRVLLSRFL